MSPETGADQGSNVTTVAMEDVAQGYSEAANDDADGKVPVVDTDGTGTVGAPVAVADDGSAGAKKTKADDDSYMVAVVAETAKEADTEDSKVDDVVSVSCKEGSTSFA